MDTTRLCLAVQFLQIKLIQILINIFKKLIRFLNEYVKIQLLTGPRTCDIGIIDGNNKSEQEEDDDSGKTRTNRFSVHIIIKDDASTGLIQDAQCDCCV